MTMQSRGTRWVAMALAATLAIATVAPAAEAGRKYKKSKRHHQRAKVTRVIHHAPAPRVVVHRHRHEPSFGAFIGGLVFGAALSHIANEAADADHAYVYWDPYCHERFVSLEVYHRHFGRHHHPRVVRVITVDDDRWIDSLRYRDGGWLHCDADWGRGYDYDYDYRYEDRGYYRH